MYYIYWIRRKNYDDYMTEGYIGFSNNIESRFESHKVNKSRVGNAIRKYDDIVIEELFCFEDEKEALEKEKELRPKKYIGWNIAIGGQKPPEMKNDISVRKKISNTIKRLGINPYSELTHSPETIEKAQRTKKANKMKWFHNPNTGEYRLIRTAIEDIPKGWIAGRKPKNITTNKQRNIDYYCHAHKWKIISPSGKKYIIDNLKGWCRENNIRYMDVYGNNRGWICNKIQENIK